MRRDERGDGPGTWARVDLPEHGSVVLPVAGLGSRGLAALVDLVVYAVLALAVAAVVVLGGGVRGSGGALVALGAMLGLGPIVLPCVFEVAWRGQSPGKWLVGLRVVGEDGVPVGAGPLLARNAMRVVDFLPAFYGLGAIVAFFSPRGQRLGDLVAGTLVVREDPGALAELGADVEPEVRHPDLHGLPSPLVRAAARLLEPTRAIEAEVYAARRSELVAAMRRHRPDWAAEDEAGIWARVERALAATGEAPG